ncbi:MAG: hypothetical protein K2K27_08100 [Muribaculaceae bacterium]|nr:hypothetical protein [Muribaculaceae bacterium]MDE6644044.1 hypothetical protein [Muribaculaceae bacterium]MDE7092975.1 hypothetical protein [Muribaculaceae bacterium]
MSEVKEINLRIANLAPIQLKVSPDDELSWKKASDAINNLWRSWSARFPDKSPQDILGMITLRFAQAFEVSNSKLEEARNAFDQIEKTLDTLLVDDLSNN